jgi:hypothetical protein
MTLKKAILLLSIVAVLYIAWAFYQGIRLQLSGFSSDFAEAVNRNLLWDTGERSPNAGRTWCAPGNEPDWPKARSQCSFVGGGIAGCSTLTFGRSCAVIGVPKIYFDDLHFREALRVALSDLCAVFDVQKRPWQPTIYFALGCAYGGHASLSVYIYIRDITIEPPYHIKLIPSTPRPSAQAYFSAWTKQITMISEHPQ